MTVISHHRQSVLYTPDRAFMKQLKRLDENLDCYYEEAHEHFVITYKRATGEPVPIYVVERDEDRGFRQPDQRDINILMQHDRSKETVKERMRKISMYMQDVREKRKKDTRDEWRNRTKDDKRQLYNAASRLAGSGKGNSTFRRINLKPKGKVFKREATAEELCPC